MKCDYCDSLTINGVFCHEAGCPAARTWKCPICGERVPWTQKTCCEIDEEEEIE